MPTPRPRPGSLKAWVGSRASPPRSRAGQEPVNVRKLKSIHRDRIAGNAQIFDFELSAGDTAEIDALDRSGGTQVALEHKCW